MSQAPKIYLVRAGRSGEYEDRALENNAAILGFREILSLATATSTPRCEGGCAACG